MKSYINLINDVCLKNSIEIQIIENEPAIILKKSNKIRFIYGKKFGINSVSSSRIADNKYLTYKILDNNAISTLNYIKIKNESLNQEIIEVLNKCYFNKNKSVVIKTINGYCGENVFKCNTVDEISKCIKKIPKNFNFLLLSEYLNIENEYRVVCLNGKSHLIYKKERPKIIGNGIDTINELLKCQISHYSSYNNLQNSNKILKNKEILYLDWKFNLSTGSIPSLEIKSKKLSIKIQNLAIKASNIIGINFSSVDIIKLKTGELKVLEINSGVVLDRFMNFKPDYYKIAFDIYEQAILAMFDN